MQTIKDKIRNSIYGHGRGWAFTKKDFSHMAPPKAVYTALSRLAEEGVIRRISRGIYEYPAYSDFLNTSLSPNMEKIAMAIARKFGWIIHPEGETALNILGLSTQIPSKYVYLTNGENRCFKIGNQEIVFRKRSAAQMSLSYKTSLVVQALKAIGDASLTKKHLRKIGKQLTGNEKGRILKETKSLPDWIYNHIKTICEELNDG